MENTTPTESRPDIAPAPSVRSHVGGWDIVAATDGSGSTPENPIGWAAIITDRHRAGIHTICGHAKFGTSQEAEVRGVVELVNYAMAHRPKEWQGGYYVRFFTDSSYVHQVISALDPHRIFAAKSHSHLWAVIAQARRRGIFLQADLLPRNSNQLMICADHASKAARKAEIEFQKSALVLKIEEVINDYNSQQKSRIRAVAPSTRSQPD